MMIKYRVSDVAKDFGYGGFPKFLCGLDVQDTGLVDTTADDLHSRLHLPGHGFSGQDRSVQGGKAFENRTVQRDALSRFHNNGFSDLNLVRVNLNQFQDQRLISSYARTALSWACGEGLLTGSLENGKVYLSPTVIAPRNQLAAVLHRFCQQVAPTPPPATGDIFVVAPDAEAIFDQMPKDFVFTSGAGGWATQLTIHPDGIFDGTYYDSNLGDTGPGYPNGTVYYCVFKGSWKDVTQTNPWEYRMYLESLSYTAPSGVTTIQNGTRYIAAEVPPYGLNNPKEFRLYLPGRPTGDLPGAYLDWARIASGWTTLPSVLPTWGLYNVGGQQGYVEDLW
mgnify:CR=1 FL=1